MGKKVLHQRAKKTTLIVLNDRLNPVRERNEPSRHSNPHP
ncbi:MAG: hypothetical protein ACI9K8_001507, partial [Reinekea sp.]